MFTTGNTKPRWRTSSPHKGILATIPVCHPCGHWELGQDGREAPTASVSHPQAWNSDKQWKTSSPKPKSSQSGRTAVLLSTVAAVCTTTFTTLLHWRAVPWVAAPFSKHSDAFLLAWFVWAHLGSLPLGSTISAELRSLPSTPFPVAGSMPVLSVQH